MVETRDGKEGLTIIVKVLVGRLMVNIPRNGMVHSEAERLRLGREMRKPQELRSWKSQGREISETMTAEVTVDKSDAGVRVPSKRRIRLGILTRLSQKRESRRVLRQILKNGEHK